MNNKILSKTKNLRTKLLMIYHEDGILDLIVGISVLILAGVMGFNFPAFIGLVGVPLTLYIPIKDSVSIPRIGYIRFEAEKDNRKRLLAFLLVGLAAFAVIVLLGPLQSWIDPEFNALLWRSDVVIFAFLLAGILFAINQVLKNPRFFIYALLSLTFVLAAYLIGLRIWIATVVVGLIMETFGAVKLIKFLKKYPIKKDA